MVGIWCRDWCEMAGPATSMVPKDVTGGVDRKGGSFLGAVPEPVYLCE